MSKTIYMSEYIFSFILISVFIFLYLSVKSERHSIEIDDAIIKIKQQGKQMEEFIQEEYKLSVDTAIKKLEELKADTMKYIYYLSQYIDVE